MTVKDYLSCISSATSGYFGPYSRKNWSILVQGRHRWYIQPAANSLSKSRSGWYVLAVRTSKQYLCTGTQEDFCIWALHPYMRVPLRCAYSCHVFQPVNHFDRLLASGCTHHLCLLDAKGCRFLRCTDQSAYEHEDVQLFWDIQNRSFTIFL